MSPTRSSPLTCTDAWRVAGVSSFERRTLPSSTTLGGVSVTSMTSACLIAQARLDRAYRGSGRVFEKGYAIRPGKLFHWPLGIVHCCAVIRRHLSCVTMDNTQWPHAAKPLRHLRRATFQSRKPDRVAPRLPHVQSYNCARKYARSKNSL
jgi:hypothetical protein